MTKEITVLEPCNQVINELVIKVTNLEKICENMKQKHEELEKIVKYNSSNICSENKNSESDSTTNTNIEENENKSEGKNASKNEFDFILYLKNFINEVDSKNTEMNKKLDDFSCKNYLK